jgi:plastocyanin domain-containing protein
MGLQMRLATSLSRSFSHARKRDLNIVQTRTNNRKKESALNEILFRKSKTSLIACSLISDLLISFLFSAQKNQAELLRERFFLTPEEGKNEVLCAF